MLTVSSDTVLFFAIFRYGESCTDRGGYSLDNHTGLEGGDVNVCVCFFWNVQLPVCISLCVLIYSLWAAGKILCFETISASLNDENPFYLNLCPVLFTWECLCRLEIRLA